MRYVDLPESEFQKLLQQIEEDCDEYGDDTPLLTLQQVILEELRQKLEEDKMKWKKFPVWNLFKRQ
ncbi:MAG TPA: hypothetical protein VGA21_02860 [Cyclobacteriaceae bacterium]|jgi:hypothetical protein